MSTQDSVERLHSLDGQLAVRLDNLCRELTQTGDLHMQKMVSTLDEAAPKPGLLVYLKARTLSVKLNGLEPVVFSAVDACTFLQVAQIYLAPTTAAAASFFEFANESFPFTLRHIRTRNQRPFYHAAGDGSYHDFTEMVGERGCSHSLLTTASQDPLYAIADKFTFGGIVEGSIAGTSEGELQRDLLHFLFFHNNFRSIPWLEGKTPVQKLSTFETFAGWHSFDPYGNTKKHAEGSELQKRVQ